MTNNERMRAMLREGPLSTADLIARFGPARTTLRTLRSLKLQESITGDDDLWHIAEWASTEDRYHAKISKRPRQPEVRQPENPMELARRINQTLLAWFPCTRHAESPR